MTENQPVNPPTTPTTPTLGDSVQTTSAFDENLQATSTLGNTIKRFMGNILSSWKVRIALLAVVLVTIGTFVFFYQHIVAEQGMKMWASRSGARPIECVLRDTNNDNYVSCSALLGEQVVPLECSSSVFNLGCRVNYGAAAPNLKLLRPQ